MAITRIRPRSVEALAAARSYWIDILLLVAIAALFAGTIALARRWEAPYRPTTEIDLSPSALPWYTLLSLARGIAAYVLSLVFTLA